MRQEEALLLAVSRNRQRLLWLQDATDLGRWRCQPWQAPWIVTAHCESTAREFGQDSQVANGIDNNNDNNDNDNSGDGGSSKSSNRLRRLDGPVAAGAG